MPIKSTIYIILITILFACSNLETKEARLKEDVNVLLEEKLLDGQIAAWHDKEEVHIERRLAVFLTYSENKKICRDYYTILIDNGREKKRVFDTSCRISKRNWEPVNWAFKNGNKTSARSRFNAFQEMNKDAPDSEQYVSRHHLPPVLLKSVKKAELKYKLPLRKMIDKAAEKKALHPRLVHSVVKVESNYNPRARSHVGAKGLMQLMPGTAKEVGVTNSYNPQQNLKGGTTYLKKMLNRKGIKGNTALALAAYNAGYGNVKKYGYKVPPFKETKNYVKKIMKLFKE